MAKFAAKRLGAKTERYAEAMRNQPMGDGFRHDGSFTNPFDKTGDGKYYANPWIHANNQQPTHAEVPNAEGGTEFVPYWQAADKFSAGLSYPLYDKISEQLAGLQEEFTNNLIATSNAGWENFGEVTETTPHLIPTSNRRGGRGTDSFRNA